MTEHEITRIRWRLVVAAAFTASTSSRTALAAVIRDAATEVEDVGLRGYLRGLADGLICNFGRPFRRTRTN